MAANPYSYSTTAASNTTIDGVSIATGMDPGKVDDALRQITSGMATIIGDLGGVTAGGTANAITLTAKANFSTLANGLIVSFRATNDNTGATTLNVNSTGAKSVRKMTTAGDAALVGAEIQVQIVSVHIGTITVGQGIFGSTKTGVRLVGQTLMICLHFRTL